MKPIRLATPEEISKIAPDADLHEGTTALAFGDGDDTDFAVIRNCMEIDPMICANNGPNATRRKALFVWGLEGMLRFQGIKQYYFNVSPEDQAWIETCEKWGAKQISTQPEIRFRKDL